MKLTSYRPADIGGHLKVLAVLLMCMFQMRREESWIQKQKSAYSLVMHKIERLTNAIIQSLDRFSSHVMLCLMSWQVGTRVKWMLW